MKAKKRNYAMDYLKSNRKGSRDAELEISVGWVAKERPHKNKKKYDRKRVKQNWEDDFNSAFCLKRDLSLYPKSISLLIFNS